MNVFNVINIFSFDNSHYYFLINLELKLYKTCQYEPIEKMIFIEFLIIDLKCK